VAFGEHTRGRVTIRGSTLSSTSPSTTPTGVLGLGKWGVAGLYISGGTARPLPTRMQLEDVNESDSEL